MVGLVEVSAVEIRCTIGVLMKGSSSRYQLSSYVGCRDKIDAN